jgi:tetratricopeptide (TPR) repeat protein
LSVQIMRSKLGNNTILPNRATAEARAAWPGTRVRWGIATFVMMVFALSAPRLVQGQSVQAPAAQVQAGSAGAATLQGFVRDSGNRPVAGATVSLLAKDATALTVRTDSAGAYRLSAVHQGTYTLRAEMTGYGDATSSPFVLGPRESRAIDLTLGSAEASELQDSSAGLPEFFDEPHFTVAGVTDTTSLGGHGSDAIARNREALAQATVSLSKQPASGFPSVSSSAATEKSLQGAVEHQPASFEANNQLGKLLVDEGKAAEGLLYLERAFQLNPSDQDNDYELALAYVAIGEYERARTDIRSLLTAQDKSHQERAEPHHLLGDIDERLGDPLEAVREYQHAAELNPSESNLFDWGAELLVHRAVEPALEVFTKGNRLYPRSVRMLAGLGASWYALGSYDQAAQRLCDASDLNPEDPAPYLFMGKMQTVETTQSEAIVERLGRFVRIQPQNALANYYYAVSLWKRRKSPEDVEDLPLVKSLLEKAVQLDPKLGLGYLQLGVLYSERKDFSHAISAYQQAVEATPRLEEAHYRLAQAYRQAGETSKAQAELRLYTEISKERAAEVERQRHELQQFVYQLRDRTSAPPPQ